MQNLEAPLPRGCVGIRGDQNHYLIPMLRYLQRIATFLLNFISGRRGSDSVAIERAHPADVDQVISLLVEDARRGHYNVALINEAQQFREMLQNAFTGGKYCYENADGDLVSTAHRAYVARASTGVVGFVLMIGTLGPGRMPILELHMLSVARSFRRRGLGRRLIEQALEDVPDGRSVVARCFPPSTVAMNLLRTMGFEESRRTEAGSIHLTRK
jgi:GNAT superfamily N-acetyltransferase